MMPATLFNLQLVNQCWSGGACPLRDAQTCTGKTMVPWLSLGIEMESLDPLLDPSLVKWVLSSSYCLIMPGLLWHEYAGSSWGMKELIPFTSLHDAFVRIWKEIPGLHPPSDKKHAWTLSGMYTSTWWPPKTLSTWVFFQLRSDMFSKRSFNYFSNKNCCIVEVGPKWRHLALNVIDIMCSVVPANLILRR